MLGYAQAKYAFITDNGGDADVNNTNLPNISAKDYVEYGLGANKALSEAWSLPELYLSTLVIYEC